MNMTFNKKQEIISKIRENISTIDTQAIKALVTIYDFQTQEEQNNYTTSEYNGVGFCGCDAEILTSFAKQYLEKKYLSPKQLFLLKKKIGKYATQLFENACRKGYYERIGKVWHVKQVA